MKKTPEVVADEVPVAVLGVELHREAARVAGRLGGVPATGDGGEAQRDLGLLALLLEELGAGVLRDRLVADGAVGLEDAEGGGAAGVHDALGDPLAVEVADLLEELVVLQGRRATGAHRPLVLVVVDRVALTVGQDGAVGLAGGRALRCDVGHAIAPPRIACSWICTDSLRRPTVAAEPPEDDLGLVDDEAGRVRGLRQGAAPTAQSTSATAPHERQTRWWWLSPDPQLEQRGRAGGLDAAGEAPGDQRLEHPVDRLRRQRRVQRRGRR